MFVIKDFPHHLRGQAVFAGSAVAELTVAGLPVTGLPIRRLRGGAAVHRLLAQAAATSH